MKRETLIYVAGVVALSFWAYSKTDDGRAEINDLGETVMSSIRGIRNNNPGNIRLSSDAWMGLSDAQTDSSFFVFSETKYGVRAIAKIIRKYQQSYGLRTIRAIINRWAPPVENDTSSYVVSVSKYMGISPDVAINVFDADTMFSLIRGIIRQEVGLVPSLLVSDSTIINGISLG